MTYKDMTFCVDNDCPSKTKCERHHSHLPAIRLVVSMSDFSTIRQNKEFCDEFIETPARPSQLLHG